ncbi:glycosyltransferase family 2 protein [Celeribacter indicus]|nr:glycosyltransferase [Celeribacter indicus]SDX58907.1 Glycosyltransferase involved in cell wall bisynthesis [Celeribacter indicus]
MPLVSVIMTFRNGMPWVLNAVGSVIAQSFTDWELILVDDGSTDGSRDAILARWGDHPGLRFVQTPPEGRGHALNRALEAARGEWVANLDADDLFHPEKLKMQMNVASGAGKHDILCTHSLVIGEQEGIPWPGIEQQGGYRDLSRQMLRRNHVNHSSILAHRNFLREIGGYDDTRRSQFDYELWLRSLHAGGRILELPAILTAKRIHARQSFEARARLRYVWSSLRLQLRYAPKLGARPLDYAFFIAKFLFGLTPRGVRRLTWKVRGA